ncbi:unnamed protein product [Linum tenue]|uniref:Uncharacterized protein n=1 Tax=Linum tenue TaxID=586396 RepID=A0AAV0QUV4_9ROSI|nr:unnamed protein product [Linum tenue]
MAAVGEESISIDEMRTTPPRHHRGDPQLPTSTAVESKSKASIPRGWFVPVDHSPTHFQKILAEVVGTYILVFIGCASALTDRVEKVGIVGIAMVWGFVLMAAIYAVGHISGAHFNPAVTLALAAIRRTRWKQVPMYVVAQLVGATLGSLTLKVLFHKQGNIDPIATQYAVTTSHLEAFLWEFIITFILMFSICANATDHRASPGLAGFAIGSTLLVNVLVAGPITGASMNPARSIGPAVASGVYTNLWLYILAPLLGALFAAMVYSGLRVPIPNHHNTTDQPPN